jgi:hypothetical protein
MATAKGFLRILKARHDPLYAGRCLVEIKYSAEELKAASHRPETDTPKPKDSGKADEVALVDMSLRTVVFAYGICFLRGLTEPFPLPLLPFPVLFSIGEVQVADVSEVVRMGCSVISCGPLAAAMTMVVDLCS